MAIDTRTPAGWRKVAVIPSRDAAHRQARWDAITAQIGAMAADEQERVITILEEVERHFGRSNDHV